MRKTQFVNEEFYHIYNCGVEKRQIFQDKDEYFKFLRSLKEFNNESYYEDRKAIVNSSFKELSSFLDGAEKIVEIIAYSLVPNHFHLILKQLKEKGISNFMHKISTSFTNLINKKYNRIGSLFQGPYKAIHVDNNDYLLWLSGYINGNIEIHGVTKAEFYEWSSFQNYFSGNGNNILGDVSIILSQFKDMQEYKNFIKTVINESKTKKEMEKYYLEVA